MSNPVYICLHYTKLLLQMCIIHQLAPAIEGYLWDLNSIQCFIQVQCNVWLKGENEYIFYNKCTYTYVPELLLQCYSMEKHTLYVHSYTHIYICICVCAMPYIHICALDINTCYCCCRFKVGISLTCWCTGHPGRERRRGSCASCASCTVRAWRSYGSSIRTSPHLPIKS